MPDTEIPGQTAIDDDDFLSGAACGINGLNADGEECEACQ